MKPSLSQLLLLSLLFLAAGCEPGKGEMSYRPYHDPFDTLPPKQPVPIPLPYREKLVGILEHASVLDSSRIEGTYSPGFLPLGTILTLLTDSTNRICDCFDNRVACQGEPELRIRKTDLASYREVMREIDSSAKAGARSDPPDTASR